MQIFLVLSLLLASSSQLLLATESRFPSGLFESRWGEEGLDRQDLSTAQSPESVIQHFIEKEFGSLAPTFTWEKRNGVVDTTHVHSQFALKYKTRTVLDRTLKINVTQTGGIESAVSNFAMPFVIQLPSPEATAQRAIELKARLWKEWEDKLGKIKGDIRIEPVIWTDPQTHVGYPAFDVRVILDSPWVLRRYVLHEVTGNVLEEKNTVREASAAVRVYKVSPYSSSTTDSVTLSDLNNLTSLRNSYFWVRRERISGSSVETVEVPPGNYTDQGGGTCATFKASPTPSEYNYTCTGSETSCCNMAFDSVNTYYHLSNFRTLINNYLTDFGATVDWTYDAPVSSSGTTNTFSVLINPVSLDFGEAGSSDDANNALYVGEPCRSDGSMERCLVFLRPAALSASASQANCGRSSSTLYDLSREALVVAHEYQHYVTDMITRIAFSASSSPKVGDAIHEGYSDYMAASYVTGLAGTDVTLVGQYALQECTPLQRQLNTIRVYDDNDASNKADVHLPGLSWASGFWKLRTEFGREVADKLALKSLFFLSTNPGFVESVEAVVSADKALYAGAHIERIRTLFYSEVKFTGKNSLPASGVGQIGFKGCGAVHGAKRPEASTGGLLLLFLTLLIFGGRFYSRRGIQ